MLPPQQEPYGIVDIPNAFGFRTPPVIEGYARVLVNQARQDTHELLEDAAEEQIRERLHVQRVGRSIFSQYVRQKVINPPEIKTDKVTDRVFLTGTGFPGRTEYELDEAPLRDETGAPEDADRKQVTVTEEEDTLLLAYSEIDWPEFRSVTEIADRVPAGRRVGLARYFDMQPEELPALLLALNLSQEKMMRIAKSAKFHKRG